MAENRKFWANFFGSEFAKMKILLCNWHMAIKTYFMNFFHLLLKNLTSQSKCLEKRRFCEFIQKATNRIFSFLHFYEGYIPRYQYRIVSNLGILGWNFSHFGPPCLIIFEKKVEIQDQHHLSLNRDRDRL